MHVGACAQRLRRSPNACVCVCVYYTHIHTHTHTHTHTFSTVGFGDLKPYSNDERLLVVATFYVGTLVFAWMLKEVEEGMAGLNRYGRLRSRTLQIVKVCCARERACERRRNGRTDGRTDGRREGGREVEAGRMRRSASVWWCSSWWFSFVVLDRALVHAHLRHGGLLTLHCRTCCGRETTYRRR